MATGDYTIEAVVTGFLDVPSTAASLTFKKKSVGAAPMITFLSGSTVYFKISEGIRVATQLVASSVCAGKTVGGCWYEWLGFFQKLI